MDNTFNNNKIIISNTVRRGVVKDVFEREYVAQEIRSILSDTTNFIKLLFYDGS